MIPNSSCFRSCHRLQLHRKQYGNWLYSKTKLKKDDLPQYNQAVNTAGAAGAPHRASEQGGPYCCI